MHNFLKLDFTSSDRVWKIINTAIYLFKFQLKNKCEELTLQLIYCKYATVLATKHFLYLWMVGVAGLWATSDLLGFHPVALHCGVMFTEVKENNGISSTWEKWNTNQPVGSGSVFFSLTKGYIWSLWAPREWFHTDGSNHSRPQSPPEPDYCQEPAAPQTSWNTNIVTLTRTYHIQSTGRCVLYFWQRPHLMRLLASLTVESYMKPG